MNNMNGKKEYDADYQRTVRFVRRVVIALLATGVILTPVMAVLLCAGPGDIPRQVWLGGLCVGGTALYFGFYLRNGLARHIATEQEKVSKQRSDVIW